VALCTLVLPTVYKICIIDCISYIEAINLDFHISVIDVDRKIDVRHNFVLHTAKRTQKNDHKDVEYFGDHTPLARIAE
jgi:hypothetical protein